MTLINLLSWASRRRAGFSPLADGRSGAHASTRSIRRRCKITRRFKNDRGTAAIEFALVLPFFLLILFAILQFGFVFFVWNDMQNAAREGARRLSVDDTVSEAQAETIVNNWLVRWPATFNVTACKIAAQTTNSANCNGTDSVSVTVTAPMSQVSIINFIPTGIGPDNLRTSVVMRKEGAP